MNTSPGHNDGSIDEEAHDRDIESLLASKPDQRDDVIDALQKEIEELKNKHDEDKFIWF